MTAVFILTGKKKKVKKGCSVQRQINLNSKREGGKDATVKN